MGKKRFSVEIRNVRYSQVDGLLDLFEQPDIHAADYVPDREHTSVKIVDKSGMQARGHGHNEVHAIQDAARKLSELQEEIMSVLKRNR